MRRVLAYYCYLWGEVQSVSPLMFHSGPSETMVISKTGLSSQHTIRKRLSELVFGDRERERRKKGEKNHLAWHPKKSTHTLIWAIQIAKQGASEQVSRKKNVSFGRHFFWGLFCRVLSEWQAGWHGRHGRHGSSYNNNNWRRSFSRLWIGIDIEMGPRGRLPTTTDHSRRRNFSCQ